MAKTGKPITLEQELDKINQIISTLESNDLPLEKSLKEYEEGLLAVKQCQHMLQQAEQKIETLSKPAASRKKES